MGVMLIALVINNNGKFNLLFGRNKGYLLLIAFSLFCYVSSLWANEPAYAYEAMKNYTMCVIIFMLFVSVYEGREENIFDAINIAGIIGAVIIALYYGPFVVWQAIWGKRLPNDLINSNTLGLLCGYVILINFYKCLKDKNIIHIPIIIFELLMLLATQSRKALLVVVIGIAGICIIRNQKKINIFSIIKILLLVLILGGILYVVSQMSLFSSINERFDGLIAGLSGEGKVDGSTRLRLQYIEIGMEQFREHPLLGIGMDNSRTAIVKSLGKHNTYTHNNYVELLCDGGIVGLVIYYSFYLYLIIGLVCKREYWDEYSKICLGFLVILLIMDYGMVSFSEKVNWICLAPIYVENNRLYERKKAAFYENYRRLYMVIEPE
jgi:O-antigen ligase